MDKFWVPVVEYKKDAQATPRRLYKKLMTHSDEEFQAQKTKWQGMLQRGISHNDTEALCTFDTLKHMIIEREIAASMYGYGYTVIHLDHNRQAHSAYQEAEHAENQAESERREITRIELASKTEAARAENQAESERREITRIELASKTEAERAENQAESERREITRIELAYTNEVCSL